MSTSTQKGLVVCGARGQGYKMGGLFKTCVVKTDFEVECRYLRVMGLERVGGLY